MKRLLVFLTAAVSLPVMLVAGCGAVQKADKETGVQEMQVQSALPTEEIKCDLIPAVKVDGKVYYDTGRESDIRARTEESPGKWTGGKCRKKTESLTSGRDTNINLQMTALLTCLSTENGFVLSKEVGNRTISVCHFS